MLFRHYIYMLNTTNPALQLSYLRLTTRIYQYNTTYYCYILFLCISISPPVLNVDDDVVGK